MFGIFLGPGCAECLIEMKSPVEQKIPNISELKIAIPFDLVPDKSDRELRNTSVGLAIYLSYEKSISSVEKYFVWSRFFCHAVWNIFVFSYQ